MATELGIELAKLGHTVHFISYGLPFRLNKFYKNIFFHEVEMLEYPLFKYPPYSLSLSAKMAEVIDEEDLDILHVHYAIPHATSAFLAKNIASREIKIITTLHGTDITIVGNHASFYNITKFSIEKSDGITCVSNYLKTKTKGIFGIEADMRVIYNFVDTSRYKEYKSKRRLGFIDRDDKVLIHISNFRPVKNIGNIIKIFKNVRDNLKCKLLLVGDGPDLGKARNIMNELNLGNDIWFLGRQDNIIPLLNISDLFLQPSKSESFGLASLEALSCSVPVIGTSVGGLREVIIDGECGYTFDPGDIEGMSKASINILKDDALRKKMLIAARKRAKDFSSMTIVPQYIDYYKEILTKKS